MELLDLRNRDGSLTGERKERELVHRDGDIHGTSHVWIVRTDARGECEVLLQKRSKDKDAYPGCYDISSAGHIPAGDEPLESALRELAEELGIVASDRDLNYAGSFRIQYEKEFHGRMFRDNEVTWVYVYDSPVNIRKLKLQESEVSEVCWFGLDEVWNEIRTDRSRFCVPAGGLGVLCAYLEGCRYSCCQ